MISITDLRFRYPEGGFSLDVPSLDVASGEKLAIIGPSGSGETTLLHLMAGIRLPQAGVVTTDGVTVTSLDDNARRDFRINGSLELDGRRRFMITGGPAPCR